MAEKKDSSEKLIKKNNNDDEKNKVIETRKFQIGILPFVEKIYQNDSDCRVFDLETNNRIFEISIKYNDSRSRFHAIFVSNGKTTSLSFFENKKIAYKSILITICSIYGIRIKNVPVDVLKGV